MFGVNPSKQYLESPAFEQDDCKQNVLTIIRQFLGGPRRQSFGRERESALRRRRPSQFRSQSLGGLLSCNRGAICSLPALECFSSITGRRQAACQTNTRSERAAEGIGERCFKPPQVGFEQFQVWLERRLERLRPRSGESLVH